MSDEIDGFSKASPEQLRNAIRRLIEERDAALSLAREVSDARDRIVAERDSLRDDLHRVLPSAAEAWTEGWIARDGWDGRPETWKNPYADGAR